MANEISSMVRASRPLLATDAGQVVGSTSTSVESNSAQPLPNSGKGLPLESGAKLPGDSSIEEAVGKINDYLQVVQRDLSFSTDDDSGRTVIKVMDRSTGELVRQIPSEEVLAIANQVNVNAEPVSNNGESLPGLLFSGVS